VTGQWFVQSTLVSSTNKTDSQDIIEILLKVALNTTKPTNQPTDWMILEYEYNPNIFVKLVTETGSRVTIVIILRH